MIAGQYAEPAPESRRIEEPHFQPVTPEAAEERRGRGQHAEPVDEESDTNTPLSGLDESFGKALANLIAAEDVALEIQRFTGGFDEPEQRFEGPIAVPQQRDDVPARDVGRSDPPERPRERRSRAVVRERQSVRAASRRNRVNGHDLDLMRATRKAQGVIECLWCFALCALR